MSKVLAFLFSLLSIAMIIGGIYMLLSFQGTAKYRCYLYDLENPQVAVKSKKRIDEILGEFEKVSYSKIEDSYKKYTKSENKKYKKLLSTKTFYKIKRDDFFKFIVGEIRIRDLLARDKYYNKCLRNKKNHYYWLINKELLYKLLELQLALKDKNYNEAGFSITNCHRHPRYNEKVGGASQSRHIQGEAIDIRVGDIDKNGIYQKGDKEIVLNLLENKIIKSKGGIGRYPGTRAVHFDVRGYRARWDRQ